MAYQSEIELRVKVIDTELRALEKRYEKIQSRNPFSASGGRSGQTAQQNRAAQAALAVDKSRLKIAEQLNQAAVKELNKRTMMTRLFKDAAGIRASYAKDAEKAAKSAEREAAAAQKTAAANRKQRIQGVQGAVAGGVISAAFPILTGGGAAESVLGGAGGLLGSLAGPLGSFAGGIGGSAIGRLITDAEELNKSLAGLNTSLGVTGTTAQITGDDLGKLANQLGIAKDETITLIEQFNGLAAAADVAALARDFGRVGGASTAEAIAVAAQSEADALSAIEQLRGIIGLEGAKQLQDTLEQESLQVALAEILAKTLELSEAKTIEDAKQVKFADRLLSLYTGIQDVVLGIDGFKTPGQIARERVAGLDLPDGQDRLGDLRDFLEQQKRLREQFKPEKTPRAGRAPAALPQSKELQLRQQILKTELSLADIETKRRALRASNLGVINLQDKALYDRLTTEIEILELARQQALVSSKVPEDAVLINNLYDQRLEKLKQENDLQREQNLLRGEQIKLQQTLTAVRNEQETEGVVRGLTRNIEDASSQDSSEMLALRIKQLRRQEDLIGGITNKIESQNAIIASGDVKKIPAAQKELKALKDRKEAIEALLPTLNQAEQQQLRLNQAIDKYGFIADEAATAMSSAVQSIITGTGSVEEAFSNMFANIGKAFIDMATQMLAQKAFMFILQALNSGASSLGSVNAGAETSNLFGNLIGNFGGGSFGGFRATGGPVNANTPYIVGERGPELMIPSSQGRIVSNENLRSEMDRSTATQSAMSRNSPAATIDVRYSVERINNVDYVTAGEFQQGMAQAAKQGAIQGEQRAMRTLKNSASTRRSVGF